MRTRTIVVIVVALLLGTSGPAVADRLKVAVPQRGAWDTSVTELGKRAGIYQKYGLKIEILYTQGGPEANQAVISGSMDIACSVGIEAAISVYSRGAPLRIIASTMIGAPDTYWYVAAKSPIRSLHDASGKTISYSQNGASSHSAVLTLLDKYKIDAIPVATGGHPATLTMTMTGQIDIGRGAAPFGLDLMEKGEIRVIARGSEITERTNRTVRVCVANLRVLRKRKDALVRFMQAYRDTLDWMYAGDAALKIYEDIFGIPMRMMGAARNDFFPKTSLQPDEVKGLDLALADALKNKFISALLTPRQIRAMVQIPEPMK